MEVARWGEKDETDATPLFSPSHLFLALPYSLVHPSTPRPQLTAHERKLLRTASPR